MRVILRDGSEEFIMLPLASEGEQAFQIIETFCKEHYLTSEESEALFKALEDIIDQVPLTTSKKSSKKTSLKASLRGPKKHVWEKDMLSMFYGKVPEFDTRQDQVNRSEFKLSISQKFPEKTSHNLTPRDFGSRVSIATSREAESRLIAKMNDVQENDSIKGKKRREPLVKPNNLKVPGPPDLNLFPSLKLIHKKVCHEFYY